MNAGSSMPIVPPPVPARGTTYTQAIAATIRKIDACGTSARPRSALDAGVREVNPPS